jgi:hypothetical protein
MRERAHAAQQIEKDLASKDLLFLLIEFPTFEQPVVFREEVSLFSLSLSLFSINSFTCNSLTDRLSRRRRACMTWTQRSW